jgi:hypothetical protein
MAASLLSLSRSSKHMDSRSTEFSWRLDPFKVESTGKHLRRAIRLGYLFSIAIAYCPRASFETGRKPHLSFWSTRFLIRIEFNSDFFSQRMTRAVMFRTTHLVTL